MAVLQPLAPLKTLTVLEIGGIGPTPFAAMLLADLGAKVIRIDGPAAREMGIGTDDSISVMHRGRKAITLDLKSAEGLTNFRERLKTSDIVIEGMRPGTAERLGIGPEDCLACNPAIVYGRISGWGREGQMAGTAGHDLNYAAFSGLVSLIGVPDRPPIPPLTLGADFPAGFLLALGIVSAVISRDVTGKGAVVDQSIVGAASLYAATFRALSVMGHWQGGPGENIFDGGAPYYRCYETADGKYLSVAPIEERFYQILIERLGLSDVPDRRDRSNWPALAELFEKTFKSRTRAEWEKRFEGSDACVTPVLELDEAVPYAKANGYPLLDERNGVWQPSGQPHVLTCPIPRHTTRHRAG